MYSCIYLTFHVSLLELYHKQEGYKTPALIEINNKEEWEVDYMLDVKEL
jgi:hypothetical protein